MYYGHFWRLLALRNTTIHTEITLWNNLKEKKSVELDFYDDWHAEPKISSLSNFFSTAYPSDKQNERFYRLASWLRWDSLTAMWQLDFWQSQLRQCGEVCAALTTLYGIPIDTRKPSAFPSCLSTYNGISFLTVARVDTHVVEFLTCC